VIEQSSLAIHIFAPDGRSLRANASWNELWNLKKGEEPEGTNIFEDEQIRIAGLISYVEDSVVDSRPVSTPPLLYEPAQAGREGDPCWLQASVYPLRDEDGSVTEMALIIEDVTEREWAEEALRKNEENLAEAQRMTHLGSWEWDVKTGEVSWSDEVFRIYGYGPQEFVPTLDKLMEVVHPDDEELVKEAIDAALYRGEPYDFEHRIVRPDGEERVVHRRAEVVLDKEGEPWRMIGTVHDITERRRAEEKLRESEERFRALVQNASDIVTILDADGIVR
jgi:PAS domain S-box-containing protein